MHIHWFIITYQILGASGQEYQPLLMPTRMVVGEHSTTGHHSDHPAGYRRYVGGGDNDWLIVPKPGEQRADVSPLVSHVEDRGRWGVRHGSSMLMPERPAAYCQGRYVIEKR
jgi:hypothetical protein